MPRHRFLLALAGLSGSGKTTVAHAVAKNLHEKYQINAEIVESDPTRKKIMGVAPTTRLSADAYTQDVTLRVVAEMNRTILEYADKGTIAIMTSVLDGAEHRREKQNWAQEHDIVFAGFWLETSAEILLERVEKRENLGNDASDAGARVVRKQIAAQQPVTDWPKIDAGKDIETIAQNIVNSIDDNFKQ